MHDDDDCVPTVDQQLADGPCGGALRDWIACFLRVHPARLETDPDGGHRLVREVRTPVVVVPVRQCAHHPLADETLDWWPTVEIPERTALISDSPFLIDWSLKQPVRATLRLLHAARHSDWATALVWLGAWLTEHARRRDLPPSLAQERLARRVLAEIEQRTGRVWDRAARETLPDTLVCRDILAPGQFTGLDEPALAQIAALDAVYVRSKWTVVSVRPIDDQRKR